MKIAIPAADNGGAEAQVDGHFGRAPFYALMDTDSSELRVEPNRGQHTGGAGLPAANLADSGADVVLCGGLGRRAIAYFAEAGIEVYVGAEGTVQNALDAYQAGKLQLATEEGACPGRHGEGEHNHSGCSE